MAEDKPDDPKQAADGKDGAAKPPESPWTALLRTIGTKALTALLTVGGLATFAAFAGSVVLWTRFEALQLPPDQIVSVAPRGELVAIGTTMLLLFGFCGGVAALAVYLVDRGGRATPGMSRGVVVIAALEALVAVWLAGGTDTLDRAIASELIVLAFGTILWATFVGGLVDQKEDELPDLRQGERVQRIEASAFRNKRNEWPKGWKKAKKALRWAAFVGTLAWLVAWRVADDTTWGWLFGIGGIAATLLAAVLVRWREFTVERARRRKDERREEEKKRKDALEKHAREEEERKEAAKAAEREAEEARKSNRISGVVSWLKASWGEGGLTLSLGRPEADPRPPEEWGSKKLPVSHGKPPSSELTGYGMMLVVPMVALATAGPAIVLGELWLAITLVAVVAIGLGLWRISQLAVGRFLWYGLAVLISVPLFGTVALASRNLDDPQVQPVALIRDGDGPAEALQGLYVTESNSRVYFANVATKGCRKDIVGDSGRLLWVPKDEVVAMAIGPLQDVDKAARASLEMAQALTPGIETSAGTRIEVPANESAAPGAGGSDEGDGGGGKEAPGNRLATAGPAIRPRFGRGLVLKPPVASPGATVKLILPTPEFGGFAGLREGSGLRLNGVELPIVGRKVARSDQEKDRLRREWLKFEVPRDATSGAVSIECAQLAGQPYLTIPQKPKARVAVKMHEGSKLVTFDSSRSRNVAGRDKGLTRRWTVAGVHMGQRASVTAALPPRLAPYHVRLEVSEAKGRSAHVDLRLLRLPDSRFPFGSARPKDTGPIHHVSEVLKKTLERDDPRGLAAIEIDGHADEVDTKRFNVRLSLRRARWLRRQLFAFRGDGASAASSEDALISHDLPIPLTIRAFGESCPIVRRPGPQPINRRVEVFLLDRGAFVVPPKSCHVGRIRRARW